MSVPADRGAVVGLAPLALGLLSTARINRHILAAARESERVDIVAVASRDAGRAEAYAREHGIGRAVGSYEALLADPRVDAIYVSLPNALHLEWSVRALEAGKHVLCEKPLSRSPQAVEAAFDAADRAGRVLMEAFMYRHHPQTRRLTELVEGGAVGRPRLVRSSFSFPLGDPDNVRWSAELEGGALMDVGCYCVNGSRLLAGEPERALGEVVAAPSGVDVAFHGTLRFPGDLVAQLDCSFALPLRQALEVVGEEGSILVEAPWRTDWGGDTVIRRGDDVERAPVDPVDSYLLQLENLADAAAGRGEPLLGRADAIGQARVLAALYRSAEEGVRVPIGHT